MSSSQAQSLPLPLPNSETVTEVNGEKSWKTEEQVLPKNNLPLVFAALLLTTFLVRGLPATVSGFGSAVTNLNANARPAGCTGPNHVRIVMSRGSVT